MTKIYLAMDGELLIASQSGGRWRTDHKLVGRAPRCLSVDPQRPERVYCGTESSGLWLSPDGGTTWQPAGQETVHPNVTAIAAGPSVLYAGTEPSTVFRSDDGGGTWSELVRLRELPSAPTWSFPPRPSTSHVRWIGLDPAQPGTVYVCIEAGALVRSFDGGQTWVDRVPSGPSDTHTLAVHPLAPGRLCSAAGDGFGAPGMGYCESPDRGDTWERPGQGLQHHYLWGLAVDPADPDTMVVSAAHSPFKAHSPTDPESVIYRRQGKAAWQLVVDGLPEPAGTSRAVLSANPAEPGTFYAGFNRGVFRSGDAGVSWQRLPLEGPEHDQRQGVSALVVTD